MRYFTIVLVLFLASSQIGFSETKTTTGPEDAVKAFLTALGNADLDGIVAAFAEDATVFLPIPTVPKRLTGIKEISDGFAPFLESIRSSGTAPPYMAFNPQDMQVQTYGDTAIVTFHLGKLPDPGAQQPSSFSRRTFVLRLVNGHWLIVHMHASNLLVPVKIRN